MLDMCKKFSVTFLTMLALLGVTGLLVLDNMGVKYEVQQQQLDDLPASVLSEKKLYDETAKTVLLLWNSEENYSEDYLTHAEEVLQDMRYGYECVNISCEAVPDFTAYETVITAFSNFDAMIDSVQELCRWVEEDGGGVVLMNVPTFSTVGQYVNRCIGIDVGGIDYERYNSICLSDEFMIGSEDFVFEWEDEDVFCSVVQLNESAEPHAWTNDEYPNPLLWMNPWGNGRFVVNNHGFASKATRGLTSAAICLAHPVSIYPVINASVFFLDDFPSPVPMGDGEYVRRDYGRDIASFYSAEWWPDMLTLNDAFGMRYTGVIIEEYSEDVDGKAPRPTDVDRFAFFGNTLLDYGGEIGIHGYNHMPLCFDGYDFMGQVDYNTWPNRGNMSAALQEVYAFTKELFPENEPRCYVPPSNILSEEGRRILKEEYPALKSVCSLYLPGDLVYEQEFEVAEDGVVEFPRVISGTVLGEHEYWAALNALNLYYVNSYFTHPDDVLDEDRGAAMGWEKMYENLTDYAHWLYGSAGNIRNLVATEAACATERYDVLSVERHDDESGIHLRLGGFWDEAYLMVRCSGTGTPESVTGGSIEPISGDFWLLHATSSQVTIHMTGEET